MSKDTSNMGQDSTEKEKKEKQGLGEEVFRYKIFKGAWEWRSQEKETLVIWQREAEHCVSLGRGERGRLMLQKRWAIIHGTYKWAANLSQMRRQHRVWNQKQGGDTGVSLFSSVHTTHPFPALTHPFIEKTLSDVFLVFLWKHKSHLLELGPPCTCKYSLCFYKDGMLAGNDSKVLQTLSHHAVLLAWNNFTLFFFKKVLCLLLFSF